MTFAHDEEVIPKLVAFEASIAEETIDSTKSLNAKSELKRKMSDKSTVKKVFFAFSIFYYCF